MVDASLLAFDLAPDVDTGHKAPCDTAHKAPHAQCPHHGHNVNTSGSLCKQATRKPSSLVA